MSVSHIILVLLSFSIFIGVSIDSYCDYKKIKNKSEVRSILEKGFPRVANQLLAPIRKQLKYDNDECELVLSVDGMLSDIEGLKLNAEKCLYSGHTKIPSPYMALSMAYELENKNEEAQKILLATIENVSHHPSFYRRLSLLNLKGGKKDNAQKIMKGLLIKYPNDSKIILETVQFFTKLNEWEIAYQFVTELEKSNSNNFEANLVLYGISKKNNDSVRSQKYYALVNEVLEKLPKDQAQKIKTKIDLL